MYNTDANHNKNEYKLVKHPCKVVLDNNTDEVHGNRGLYYKTQLCYELCSAMTSAKKFTLQVRQVEKEAKQN